MAVLTEVRLGPLHALLPSFSARNLLCSLVETLVDDSASVHGLGKANLPVRHVEYGVKALTTKYHLHQGCLISRQRV